MLQMEHRGFYASPAWYALRVGGQETGRCLSGNRFFHSQIKHWASWQISTLMRFFERPGGFRWYHYTTNRAKRKAADPKAYRFNAFREKSHPIEIIVSHIQHFFNAFQPVSYRCPAVMGLCCNVRQREPLNVPQKSYLSVYPPKRCAFDNVCHLLSVKSLQRSGQHHTSRRHRQHRARKAAATVRRCAPYCQAPQTGDETSPYRWRYRDGMFS